MDIDLQTVSTPPSSDAPPSEPPSSPKPFRYPSSELAQAEQEAHLPKRQCQTEAEQAGPWRDAYNTLAPKIGTGCIIGLFSKRGCGKTRMGVALARRAIHNRLSLPRDPEKWDYRLTARAALYATAIDVFLDIRAGFRDRDDSEQSRIEKYTERDLLVLDEIQERGNTEWEDRLITHIVDRRYADMKDTVLIGNLATEAIESSLGASVVSRLQECGEVVIFDWPSYRDLAAGVKP